MLNYQPPAQGLFLGQVPLRSAARMVSRLTEPSSMAFDLGGRHPKLAQTFDQIMGWPPAAGDILRLLFHGGTTWLGITIGSSAKDPWVSGIAWILGVGNGLAALADVASLVKRATGTHPPEGVEKAPVTTPEPVPALPGGQVIPGTRSL